MLRRSGSLHKKNSTVFRTFYKSMERRFNDDMTVNSRTLYKETDYRK